MYVQGPARSSEYLVRTLVRQSKVLHCLGGWQCVPLSVTLPSAAHNQRSHFSERRNGVLHTDTMYSGSESALASDVSFLAYVGIMYVYVLQASCIHDACKGAMRLLRSHLTPQE